MRVKQRAEGVSPTIFRSVGSMTTRWAEFPKLLIRALAEANPTTFAVQAKDSAT
jgi:hypothetical protein